MVNVDGPSQSRDYLHRAGRTGRAGAAGLVLSLMTEAESRLAGRYAEELGIAMEAMRLVRGALTPAEDENAQTLAPAPRKYGPRKTGTGKPTDKARTEKRSGQPASEPGPKARREAPRQGRRPAIDSDGRKEKTGPGPKPAAGRSGPDASGSMPAGSPSTPLRREKPKPAGSRPRRKA